MRRYQEDDEAGTSELVHNAPYNFLEDHNQIKSDLVSDEYDVSVVSSTFKITIPAHKKWGFYLINTSDTPEPHTYYTDEEFNEKPAVYANRFYSRTSNITAGNKTYTIFGLEDWYVDDRAGEDSQCQDGSAEFQFNCMDANDIVFILDDNYEEPEEPEKPEEPKNPETIDISLNTLGIAIFALASFGVVGFRFVNFRG